MSGLVEHLERYLGRMGGGFTVDESGQPLPFQVALFQDVPLDGTMALATLGLSDRPLAVDGGTIRQELVLMFRGNHGYRNLPGVLQQVASEALATGRAYLRGEVIGGRGPIVDGTAMEAFYVAAPVYLPDEFHAFRLDASSEAIMLAWLVPITVREAAFVARRGWSAFESLLEKHDPNLLDLDRPSMRGV